MKGKTQNKNKGGIVTNAMNQYNRLTKSVSAHIIFSVSA